jgi:hypothetical protein
MYANIATAILYANRFGGSDESVSPHISRHISSFVNRLKIINYFY